MGAYMKLMQGIGVSHGNYEDNAVESITTNNLASSNAIPWEIKNDNKKIVRPAVAHPLQLKNAHTSDFSYEYGASKGRHIMKSTSVPPDLMDVVKEMTTLLINRYRSPLTGIMGFVELLKNKELPKNDHYLETINNGLGEISSLLDKMEEINHEPIVNSHDIRFNELVRNVVNDYPIEGRNRIHIYDNKASFNIRADYELMSKLIHELLDNALDHDKQINSDVLIEFNKEGDMYITNFGVPIPSEFVTKMFYPFYSTKVRNLGLGLTRASLMAQAQNLVVELVSNNEVDGICFALRKIK
jgi:hypothetical protein